MTWWMVSGKCNRQLPVIGLLVSQGKWVTAAWARARYGGMAKWMALPVEPSPLLCALSFTNLIHDLTFLFANGDHYNCTYSKPVLLSLSFSVLSCEPPERCVSEG